MLAQCGMFGLFAPLFPVDYSFSTKPRPLRLRLDCKVISSDRQTRGIMSANLPESSLSLAARYAIPFTLLLIPIWKTQVSTVVPEPYLDEAFHVPQAQAYWARQWMRWDPKITTPPGLYLWSYLICAVALTIRGSPTELDAEALRTTNVGASAVLLPWRLQSLLESVRRERNSRPAGSRLSHTVLNICLFPPLFFFSGLYYTDILALLVVVEAYNWDIKRTSVKGFTPFRFLVFIGLGLAALLFRQTNIFWVSVFLGGLQALRTLRQTNKACDSSALIDIAKKGFQNELYDPYVIDASFAGENPSFNGFGTLTDWESRLFQNCCVNRHDWAEEYPPPSCLRDSSPYHSGGFRWLRTLEQWRCNG